MKILTLLLFTTSLCLSAELTLPSSVDNVLVFKDRAFVTRGLKASLNKGNTTIRLSKLPVKLMQDSLKVKTSDASNLKVLGVRVKEIEIIKTENEEFNELTNKREKNKSLIEKQVTNIKSLVHENQKLKELQDVYQKSFAVNMQDSKWSKKSFQSFVEFTQSKKLDLISKWKKEYTILLDLYDEEEFLNAQIAQMSSVNSTKYLDVFIDLEIDKKASYEVSLQYLIRGANWEPVYDIRVDSTKNAAFVYQYAYVNQSTGEDWDKAKIELSNRQSKLNTTPPTINSYQLNYKEVKEVKTKIQSTSDNASSLRTGSTNTDAEEYKFIVSGVQTIKSGMPRTRVFIKSKRSAYKEHLEVVPKLYEYVYRKGVLKNNFNWNLQAGKAYIYYDNQFIQTMYLDKTMKSQEFYINAGIDYDVKVDQWFSNKNSEKGLINSKKVYKRTFFTKLHNYSTKSKNIKILAQYPVSETKEIEVSTDGSSSGLNELEGNPSWSYWDVKVGPNIQRTLDLKVEVSTPKDFDFSWGI